MGPSMRTCSARVSAARPIRSDSTDFSTPAITFATTYGHYISSTDGIVSHSCYRGDRHSSHMALVKAESQDRARIADPVTGQ